MALLDDINRVLRDFERYTGDGQPGAPSGAPLPTGDPSSGIHNLLKHDLRELLKTIAQSMGDEGALQEIITQVGGKADKTALQALVDEVNEKADVAGINQRAQRSLIALTTTGAGGNAIEASLPASYAGVTLADETVVSFRAAADNTGPVTLMGLPLRYSDGVSELANGELRLGRRYLATYSTFGGAHFRLMSGGLTRAEVNQTTVALRGALASMAEAAGSYSPLIPLLDRIGLWIDFTDRHSLFQDAGGTIPVRRDGDRIGRVLDRSGNNYHFAAENDTRRPAWRQGSKGSRGVAEFAGTLQSNAQYLTGTKNNLTPNRQKITSFVLASYENQGGNQTFINHSISGNTQIARLTLQVTNGRPNLQVRTDDATSLRAESWALLGQNWNYKAGDWIVLEGQVDVPGGTAALWTNGHNSLDGIVHLIPDTAFEASGEAASYISHPTNRLRGRIAAIVEIVGDLSERDREGIYTYFRSIAEGVEVGNLERYDPTGPLPVVFFWFNAPNVIRVASGEYLVGGVDPGGTVMAGHYNFNAGTIRHAALHRMLEIDDHNIPSFAQMPDGTVIAVYSKHNGDGGTWLTKTITPGDYSAWTAPVDIGPQIHTMPGHSYLVSYNFLFRHSGEGGRLYYVHREGDQTAAGGASILTQEYWVISWSDDNGATWTRGRKLWGPQRPYTRVWSNGVDRLDFLFNDSHPNADMTNRLHHCYLKGGNFYKSDGTLIGGMDALPLDLNTGPTLVFDADFSTVGNSWVWDLTYDHATGRPVGTYVTYRNNYADLDYYQCRWNGTAWTRHHITAVGASLSPNHNVYAGGVVQDPTNINRVYCSVMVDASGAVTKDRNVGVYQIFRFETADGGATWTRAQLTHERQHAFRPVLAPGGRLFYVTGEYGPHYTEYFTEVRSLDVG